VETRHRHGPTGRQAPLEVTQALLAPRSSVPEGSERLLPPVDGEVWRGALPPRGARRGAYKLSTTAPVDRSCPILVNRPGRPWAAETQLIAVAAHAGDLVRREQPTGLDEPPAWAVEWRVSALRVAESGQVLGFASCATGRGRANPQGCRGRESWANGS